MSRLHQKRKSIQPRMSKEKLNELTTEEVEKCGLNNFFQAQFAFMLSTAVVGSSNYKLLSLQPCFKFRTTDAWISAFRFVISYLRSYQMRTTIESIQTEIQSKNKNPNYLNIIQNDSQSEKAYSLIQQMILHKIQRSPYTFRNRVKDFI